MNTQLCQLTVLKMQKPSTFPSRYMAKAAQKNTMTGLLRTTPNPSMIALAGAGSGPGVYFALDEFNNFEQIIR
jgi:hypothetical protein